MDRWKFSGLRFCLVGSTDRGVHVEESVGPCNCMVGVVIAGSEQASFFVVSAGDSSDGKNFFHSTLPANRRRQYWKLIIYKYLISWSTFISGNYSFLVWIEFWIYLCFKKWFIHFELGDFPSLLNSWYKSGGVTFTIHPFYQILLVSWSHIHVYV